MNEVDPSNYWIDIVIAAIGMIAKAPAVLEDRDSMITLTEDILILCKEIRYYK